MADKKASKAKHPEIILVTDPTYTDERIVEVVEACARALPPGSFAVQLRDKKKEPGALRAFAQKLREATKPSDGGGGALLIINGNPSLAKDVGADGVHLGGLEVKVADARKVLGDGAFVTIAAHSDQAVKLGARDGADGALVSTIFASPGKAVGRGVDALRTARAVSGEDFLIYALGGVDRENAAECVLAGADGVAAIRALLLASDPGAEARAIYDRMHAT
ncbi:MAG: thiamine phosphate synthase [Polyangiaceae bacterium]|jgi:thiamine-phosphate pyrophosphorylase